MVTNLTSAVAKSNLGVEKFSANLDEFSAFAKEKVDPTFSEYGLALTKLIVENVSMPPELQKEDIPVQQA